MTGNGQKGSFLLTRKVYCERFSCFLPASHRVKLGLHEHQPETHQNIQNPFGLALLPVYDHPSHVYLEIYPCISTSYSI